MDSNTYSTSRPVGRPVGLAALTTALEDLAAQDLAGLPDAVRAERVLVLRRLLDRLEGHWLAELAAAAARGAAGAEAGVQVGSTAGWLRQRLRMGASTASSSVRTAGALFGGPLTQTAQALTDGELSPAHASVLAAGTQDLPAQLAAEAEPVLVEAAGRLDPPRLRRAVTHLRLVADPDHAASRTERRHQQRGLWLTSTLDNMVAIDGLLEPEAGQIVLSALEPLARPHRAQDERSGGQRRADALTELARRALEGGQLPQTGGVRPQLTVVVDLDSLQGRHDLGGDTDCGALATEACRRLACDGALTRVLVNRHPTTHHKDPTDNGNLAEQLRTAATRLPPVLGGAPSQPLDLGRTSRVVTPAQRLALAVRDGGGVVPGCDRPWPGGRRIIWGTGWMAARPIWPTWCCCAGPIIGRSMTAAGS
jgi:hypothetical protein